MQFSLQLLLANYWSKKIIWTRHKHISHIKKNISDNKTATRHVLIRCDPNIHIYTHTAPVGFRLWALLMWRRRRRCPSELVARCVGRRRPSFVYAGIYYTVVAEWVRDFSLQGAMGCMEILICGVKRLPFLSVYLTVYGSVIRQLANYKCKWPN